MSRITFTATTPAGTTVKRESASKTYSHAIITDDNQDGSWGALGWASTEVLAEKSAVTFRNRGIKNVQVVPAEVATKPAKAVTNVEVDGTVVATTERHDLTAAEPAKATKPAKVEKAPAAKPAKAEPTAAEKRAAEKADADAKKAEQLQREVEEQMAKDLTRIQAQREALVAEERKIVTNGRKMGLSWATLAAMVGMSAIGLRNRYIDLVEAKDAK